MPSRQGECCQPLRSGKSPRRNASVALRKDYELRVCAVIPLMGETAASPWVNKEVAYWLEHKSAATLLIAVTDGELVWDNGVVDRSFSWASLTPLRPRLSPTLRGRKPMLLAS